MSLNTENSPPQDLIDALIDEDETGSEIECYDSDEGEMVVDADIASDYEDMNIEDKPIFSQSPSGAVYPHSTVAAGSRAPPVERERSPLPAYKQEASPERERSRSSSPLPYSPLTSPFRDERSPRAGAASVSRAPSVERERSPLPAYKQEASPERERLFVDFRDGRSDEPEAASARGRSGGRRPSGASGGTRSRGGASFSSRGRRAATAVTGESGWRRGERILEVCLDDDDAPLSLIEMVHNLESSRCARDEQQLRRDRRRILREDGVSEDEDDYYDAEGSIARELFGGDSGAMKFAWSPMATFSGSAEEFDAANAGPNVIATSGYEAFRQYWDDEILNHIVRETNRYAEGIKLVSARFASTWYDTNVDEILILFAFWMMLGIIRMPSLKSCFSNHPLLKTSTFRSMITEARYYNLNRALHFVDNATRTPNSSKLFCLGPIIEHLNRKFQEAYTLSQNISIDESLTLWKGNLSFRQYIKTKAARLGIKTFELCESDTGYLWSFFIYAGKDGEAPSRMPKSTEVVLKLIKPLLNRGHKLFMDNWFNSPLLARFLKRNKTDCVGTLRNSCKNVPAIIQLASLKEGSCVARHSGDVVVMAYQDKKTVYTISTCHGAESVHFDAKPGKPAHYKPAVIADYNISMGGVDKKDQMLEPYLVERKRNHKWYKKMFKRLLNVSIFNSRILVNKLTGTQLQTQAFRLNLVADIMREHHPNVPKSRTRADIAPLNLAAPSKRLAQLSHFIARIPPPIGTKNSANHSGRRLCQWCLKRHGISKKTSFFCETCGPALCLDECFRKYHTEA